MFNKFCLLRSVAFFVTGAVIAFLSWQAGCILFLLCLPLMVRVSASGRQSFLLFFGYYLFGSHNLLDNIPAFFTDIPSSYLLASAVWLLWAGLLSLPFLLLPRKSYLSFTLALVASSLPPMAVIGWLSPLTVSGMMLPGAGIFGLVLTLAFMSCVAVGSLKHFKIAIILMINLGVLANVNYLSSSLSSDNNEHIFKSEDSNLIVRAVNTRIPFVGKVNPSDDFTNVKYLQGIIKESAFNKDKKDKLLLVLPEEVLGVWRPAKAYWWGRFVANLAKDNVFILVGGDEHGDDAMKYSDAVFMMTYIEKYGQYIAVPNNLTAAKIPMPGGNWNPLHLGGKASAELDLAANKNSYQVVLDGHPVQFSVCYEDFLIWPHINAEFRRLQHGRAPSGAMISVANSWFQSEDLLSVKVQQQSIAMMSRLFGVKLIRAVNNKYS